MSTSAGSPGPAGQPLHLSASHSVDNPSLVHTPQSLYGTPSSVFPSTGSPTGSPGFPGFVTPGDRALAARTQAALMQARETRRDPFSFLSHGSAAIPYIVRRASQQVLTAHTYMVSMVP